MRMNPSLGLFVGLALLFAFHTMAAQESAPTSTPSPESEIVEGGEGLQGQEDPSDPEPTPVPPSSAAPRIAPTALPFITIGKANPSPAPYRAEEFPGWAKDLRRFEIISLGSFPLALFYAGFGWDLYRYATARNAWTGAALSVQPWDATLMPWPLKNAYSYKPTDDEEKLTLITAGAISLAVGVVDIIIVTAQRRARLSRDRVLERMPLPPPPSPELDGAPPPQEAAGQASIDEDGGTLP